MYTIYISHHKGSNTLDIIKNSRLNYTHNLIYNTTNDFSDMKNLIMESQFMVADISEQSIDVGIAIGIALEQNIRVIFIKKEETNVSVEGVGSDVITYKDGDELVDKLEKSIEFIGF